MPNNECLQIITANGTQIKIGPEFFSAFPAHKNPLLLCSQTPEKESIPHESATTALTNRQLVIMSEALLDVSLSSQFTNIKALARFISKVSGRSEGSIRTCINNGIDYDNAHVRNDVEAVATLLDAIKPELAQLLRNNIE